MSTPPQENVAPCCINSDKALSGFTTDDSDVSKINHQLAASECLVSLAVDLPKFT
jgi:hypothetical protein